MKNIKDSVPSPYRQWYNKWVEVNARGKVLDVGKSKYYNYGFPTIDINSKLHPTYTQDICCSTLPDNAFDVVLCNGMYECVENPQKMINECLRIAQKTVLFGFVGINYKPYKKRWRYYEFREKIPKHKLINFNGEYYFLICKK